MNEKWTELWEFAGQYKYTATVIVCGDANAAIGNKANMRNNCSSVNCSSNNNSTASREDLQPATRCLVPQRHDPE